MSQCAWKELRNKYLESVGIAAQAVAKGNRAGQNEFGDMMITSGQILQIMMSKYGYINEVSDPPEVEIACQTCETVLRVDKHGKINVEGECEQGELYSSLTQVARTQFG